jgi:hypothetical protein
LVFIRDVNEATGADAKAVASCIEAKAKAEARPSEAKAEAGCLEAKVNNYAESVIKAIRITAIR